MVMAKAETVVVDPNPLVIAGVSKKSFGYTLFNGMEEEGAKILNAKLSKDPLYLQLEKQILPGPAYNNNYIVTMAYLAKNLGKSISKEVDFGRYRRLQIYTIVTEHPGFKWLDYHLGRNLMSRLPLIDKINTEFCLLRVTEKRLELRLTGKDAPGPVYAEFVGGPAGYRRIQGGGRKQHIARAVGLKGSSVPFIIDATAGLGRDSFVLAALGCRCRISRICETLF